MTNGSETSRPIGHGDVSKKPDEPLLVLEFYAGGVDAKDTPPGSVTEGDLFVYKLDGSPRFAVRFKDRPGATAPALEYPTYDIVRAVPTVPAALGDGPEVPPHKWPPKT